MSNSRQKLDVSNADEKQKMKILEIAADVRKFEIEKFWQRSIFFWGFIGAAFVAYAQLYGRSDLPLFVACFGLVCSVAWTLQNRGSKYWQEAWEAKVESVEKSVLGVELFANREPRQPKGFWGAWTFSVSKLTIALSDFTVLVWIVLAMKAFPFPELAAFQYYAAIAAAVTAIYIVLLLICCRQSERNTTSK